jgi:hypothetical protein
MAIYTIFKIGSPEVLELNGKEYKEVYLNFNTKRRAKVIA